MEWGREVCFFFSFFISATHASLTDFWGQKSAKPFEEDEHTRTSPSHQHVRFPVVLLDSPTLGCERISILEVHTIFDNKDDTVGLLSVDCIRGEIILI